MHTYDEIIASGYFVFKEKLSTEIITTFLGIRMSRYGEKFNRNSLRLHNLKEIVKFRNPYYELQDKKTLTDLLPYIKPELIVLFQVIQEEIENQKTDSSKSYIKK